jgi:hypothetical protein
VLAAADEASALNRGARRRACANVSGRQCSGRGDSQDVRQHLRRELSLVCGYRGTFIGSTAHAPHLSKADTSKSHRRMKRSCGVMKFLLAMVSVCTMISLAAPASADPAPPVDGDHAGFVCTMISLTAPAYADLAPPVDGDDAGFLAALRQDGIGYASPGQAVTAGKAACTCLNNGESGLRVVHDVKTDNPKFDMESASQFAVIAAKYYCPQQLSKS